MKLAKAFLILTLGTTSLFCEQDRLISYEFDMPSNQMTQAYSDSPAPSHASPFIKGIVLLGSEDDVSRTRFVEAEGVVTYNTEVPGSDRQVRSSLSCYIGKPLNDEILTEIKRSIIEYYQDHNYPVVLVYTPEQDVTDGILQVVVEEGRVR